MQEYQLVEQHLKKLPMAGVKDGLRIYHRSDVLAIAKLIHGEAKLNSPGFIGGLDRARHARVDDTRDRIAGLFPKLLANLQRYNDGNSKSVGANQVVKLALVMNCADLAIKGYAWWVTGSKSLLAEVFHSSLDLCNQLILLYGNKVSIRKPNPDFPYGFGNMRYICSMYAGFGILGFGCGLSVYNGVQGLIHPAELQSLTWGIGLLLVSGLLQTTSFMYAISELRARATKKGLTLRKYFRSATADPSLKVVLFEDAASICGVFLALGCVTASHCFDLPMLDSIGSILIGGVLGMAAFLIIRSNSLILVGRSVPKQSRKEIIDFMSADPIVRKMHDVKLIYSGDNEIWLKAEIEYNGREIARRYLSQKCNTLELVNELDQIKSGQELEEFVMRHGEQMIQKVGDEVDRLEQKTRAEYPQIRHMDLESH